MLKKYHFLLINNKTETQWPQFLQETIGDLGELSVLQEAETKRVISQSNFDLIIIDAGAIQDVASLILYLRAQRPESRILVVTSAPTWQAAREVLKAGASDYINRSLDKKELHSKVVAVLEFPPRYNPLKSDLGRRV